MKLRIARRICFAHIHGYGKRLNWNAQTLLRMEQHRRKWNKRHKPKVKTTTQELGW